MDFSCGNAEFQITKANRLTTRVEFQHNGSTLHLFGSPSYLVRYEDLAYDDAAASVQKAVESILVNYLKDPGRCADLARLGGDFLVLITQAGDLKEIITPDTLDSTDTIYFSQREGKLLFSDDYRLFLRGMDLLDPKSYNLPELKHFFTNRTCPPGRTYLAGLFRLQPHTIFKVVGNQVYKEKIIFFPKTDDRPLGTRELLQVFGRRLNHPEYSVAYSTGIDSHLAFRAAQDRVKQLLTVYLKRPYQSHQKTREVGAAFINSIKFDKELTIVPIDMEDPVNIEHHKYSAQANPFKANINNVMYHLMKHAVCDTVITGELSDEFLCISESRPWTVRDAIASGAVRQQLYRRLRARLYQRKCITREYQTKFAQQYAATRITTASPAELERAAGLEQSWPLSYLTLINGMVTGNVDHWNNPARFHGKKMVFPFAEPLLHYVVVNSNRPWRAFLDPKWEIRHGQDYLCHKDIQYNLDTGKTFIDSSINRHFHAEMAQAAPELKAFLDNTAAAANQKTLSRANESKVFCYLLVMQSLLER